MLGYCQVISVQIDCWADLFVKKIVGNYEVKCNVHMIRIE